MRIGTPSVLQFAALDAALDIWDDVDMADIRAKSIELGELFIELIEKNCPELALVSPRDPARRGSQISFRFGDGYIAMKAIIERGVIGDFRAPDIMRFAMTPLFIDKTDIENGAKIIAEVVNSGVWREAKYQVRNAVT
jgi:kynureninase